MTLTLLATARTPETLVPFLVGGPEFQLEVVCDVDALAARTRDDGDQERPAAIVVELHHDAVGPVGPVVRALRRRYPGTPLVVACTDNAPGRDLLHAARAGAEHFAYLAQDDLGAMLTRLTEPFADVLALECEQAALVAGLPRPIGRVLNAILRAPASPDSVLALAATVGVSTRTFERRASRHGWPAPRQFLGWGRLVRGAAAVDTAHELPGAALGALLAASGFSSYERAARAYARQADVTLPAVLAMGMRALEPALLACFGSRTGTAVPPITTRSSAA